MKQLSIFIILLLTTTHLHAADAELRVWTPAKGDPIKARMVQSFGGRVTLLKEDDKRVSVALSSLSTEDKAYLRELRNKKTSGILNKGRKPSKFASKSSDGIQADWMTDFELGVIIETNLARADPAEYAKHLEEYRSRYKGDNIFATKRGNMMSQEGLKAVDEAIAYLKKAKKLPPIMPSRGLSRAAKAHADDIGPEGITGHDGTDGSTSKQRIERQGKWKSTIGENISFGSHSARDVIMSLIIDDGVPSRGHRTNIFASGFKVAGVAVGKHKKYGVMCVIDYAGGFSD
jgi:uncharacterized protein YkwD